jgi:hypothetical protein
MAHLFSETPTAQALSMQPYTLNELWSESQIIARGTIAQRRIYRGERGRIWTEFTLVLKEALIKASTQRSSKILFILPGGTLDGLTQMVPGVPQLENQQELIVFLRCSSTKPCAPVGFGQGLWIAQKDEPKVWRPLTDHTRWVGDQEPLQALPLGDLITPPHQP